MNTHQHSQFHLFPSWAEYQIATGNDRLDIRTAWCMAWVNKRDPQAFDLYLRACSEMPRSVKRPMGSESDFDGDMGAEHDDYLRDNASRRQS